MKRPKIAATALAGSLLLLWVGYRCYLAYFDLVTLNVRNMDVRQVVRKMEWQTWETILVNTNVNGAVTLNVTRAPLADVLNILALQTNARWTALYPLFRTSAASAKLEKVVRGELPGPGSGWENLQKVAKWQRGAGSAFGNAARAANNVVSAQFDNKDIQFAALALSRFSQAQVIAEDSATGNVNLKLEQVRFDKAVAQLAKQAHRKWDKIYSIQPRSSAAKQQTIVRAEGTNAPPSKLMRLDDRTNMVFQPLEPKDPAEQAQQQSQQLEAILVTMSPEERQKAEQQIQQMTELQSLPEAERQSRMQEIAAQAKQASQADLDERMKRRLRDGTIDQRLAHDRELLNRRSSKSAPKP